MTETEDSKLIPLNWFNEVIFLIKIGYSLAVVRRWAGYSALKKFIFLPVLALRAVSMVMVTPAIFWLMAFLLWSTILDGFSNLISGPLRLELIVSDESPNQ